MLELNKFPSIFNLPLKIKKFYIFLILKKNIFISDANFIIILLKQEKDI